MNPEAQEIFEVEEYLEEEIMEIPIPQEETVAHSEEGTLTPPPEDQEEHPRTPSPVPSTSSDMPSAPKRMRPAVILKQPKGLRQQREEKKQTQLDQQKAVRKEAASESPEHWIARWAKENITQTEINSVLGKSSLNIQEQEGRISISFMSPVPKTGGITRNLEKLSDPKSTSVPKLHVYNAFWSTLLPAMVVVHLNKFSQTTIQKWHNASFIHWDLLGKTHTVTLDTPKGEVIYLESKAQHEEQFSDDWISALLSPMKTYMKMSTMNNSLISVQSQTMTLEINRQPYHSRDDSTLQQDVLKLSEKIKTLSFNYVKTRLLMKGKQRDIYAARLKGLPFNSTEISANALKQHYSLPKHWYFRNQQNKDSKERKPSQ